MVNKFISKIKLATGDFRHKNQNLIVNLRDIADDSSKLNSEHQSFSKTSKIVADYEESVSVFVNTKFQVAGGSNLRNDSINKRQYRLAIVYFRNKNMFSSASSEPFFLNIINFYYYFAQARLN